MVLLFRKLSVLIFLKSAETKLLLTPVHFSLAKLFNFRWQDPRVFPTALVVRPILSGIGTGKAPFSVPIANFYHFVLKSGLFPYGLGQSYFTTHSPPFAGPFRSMSPSAFSFSSCFSYPFSYVFSLLFDATITFSPYFYPLFYLLIPDDTRSVSCYIPSTKKCLV